jgi:hypothetical protein
LAAELGGGQLALSGAKAVGGAGLKALGAAGAGTAALAAGVTASFAAPAIGVLAEVGEDREKMGAKYRSSHAQVLGSELAQQAIQRGDLTPVIGRTGGDKEVLAAVLTSLEGKMDMLNETLKSQVAAGIAAELKRAPLKVQLPQNPNQDKGN